MMIERKKAEHAFVHVQPKGKTGATEMVSMIANQDDVDESSDDIPMRRLSDDDMRLVVKKTAFLPGARTIIPEPVTTTPPSPGPKTATITTPPSPGPKASTTIAKPPSPGPKASTNGKFTASVASSYAPRSVRAPASANVFAAARAAAIERDPLPLSRSNSHSNSPVSNTNRFSSPLSGRP